MKNIDKIRAMSAEELVLNYQNVRACEVCSYFEDEECSLKGYAGSRECNGGRIKWLEKENNPMPELEIGDIIYSFYPKIDRTVSYVYLGDNVMWCDKDGLFVILEDKMKKYIKVICRKENDSFCKAVIWRAENSDR